ncbi:hypothetical protein CR513_06948, partial [Mucuna pruriens]
MFWKVEINIPLLDAIKKIPKYAKFLKELCVHKRKKMKGGVELGGIVSALTRNDEFIAGAWQVLPKKCRDPKIFSIPCTIGDCTFANAMLDLGASINVMPTSIYKSLNFGDLEPTRMTIQLANRSVVQSLGILEDVLVQVNDMIFPTDFYVLDMEDETSGKGSTLILGRPFLMTSRQRLICMLGCSQWNMFNIFEALKHPTKDHSLFGIDLIDELVEEHLQLDTGSDDISNFAEDTKVFDCLGSVIDEADCRELREVHNLSDSEDDITDLVDLSQEVELLKLLDQVCKYEDLECSNNAEVQVVETEKQLSMQVETVEANSIRKTNAESNLTVYAKADSNLGSEDRKHAEAEPILDNQIQNLVLARSDFSTKENAKFDSNHIRVRSIPANMSRPQK